MIISQVMTRNPICSHPDMTINDVRSMMDKENIGHIPVLDKKKSLAGIVTRKDLLKAGPSPATTLDMFEISYLLSKVTVKNVMEKKVLTVDENEVVEEAARVMADKKIGCLPVMRGKILAGIITETDLFRVFVNAFGARHKGVRFTCSIREKPGQLRKLAQSIAEKGGNIISFITFDGDDNKSRRITVKVGGLRRTDTENLISTFPDLVLEDIRE